METVLLPTTVVGSYPQPDWLIDRISLGGRLPPRVRARDLWSIPDNHLKQAQDDAVILAVREMEKAGVDIVSDGEVRRESYSNVFATALEGIDADNPGTAIDRTGHLNPVPRVVGPVRRKGSILVGDLEFLKQNTCKATKITIPGPFTMSQQVQNDYYGDEEEMAMDYASAVNEEIEELFTAGAAVVQLDEPYVQARPEAAQRYAVKVINRALDGIKGSTALHLCFGYAAVVNSKPSGYSFLTELETCAVKQVSIEAAQPQIDLSILKNFSSKIIILGVIDLGDSSVETPDIVAQRIRDALNYVPPSRLILAPDCGMKYISRDVAFRKLSAMVNGSKIVREEL